MNRMSTVAAADELDTALAQKVRNTAQFLQGALLDYGRVVYATSLGSESLVLTDLIFQHAPQIDIFTVDTGRLPEATLELLERIERHYGRRIRVVYPESQAIQNYVADHGVNGFYRGLAERQACCSVRKLEPFKRAIAGYGAWVTGVRQEQSSSRALALASEYDARFRIQKLSPLLLWTRDEVWTYIRARRLPYNPMHDVGYPSIGCAPCTRAIEPGQDSRAGRWWWESPESRECGLQPRKLPGSISDL
jgi:phosphoadenosine phosphosulfate reductase